MFYALIRKMLWVVTALVSTAELSGAAAEPKLTIDAIFSERAFDTESVSVRFLDAFDGYVRLEKSAESAGGEDIVLRGVDTDERTVLVPAAHLIPAGESSPLKIEDFAFSQDQSRVLIYTNSKKVWRYRTRGDYWVLDRGSRELRQLGHTLPPATLMFAKFSPDAARVGYVHAGNIYVEDVATGEIDQLTDSDSPSVTQGTFDWAYEEEFQLRDGFRWSPDGHRIAFWKIDSSRVGRFPLVDNSRGLYPEVTWIPYPKVGTTNPECEIGVIDVETRETIWLDLPNRESDFYVARMEWIPESSSGTGQLILQQFNRLQNTNHVLVADARSGSCRQVLAERDDAWVDVHDEMQWIGPDEFTWVSERSGWRHLYVVNLVSGEIRQVSSGDWDMIQLLALDQKRQTAYFLASPENAASRFLYSIQLDGTGLARLTPDSEFGDHGYRISADARFALHTQSSLGRPPVVELVSLPGHRSLRVLVDQKKLSQRLAGLRLTSPKFLQVALEDGTSVDAWQILPPDFDPSRKYPLLVYVYGEPAGQTVRDRWGGSNYLWHQLLASRGYVVMSFDNRGTPAPRGRAWRKSVYRQVGVLAPQDQAAALRSLLASSPWIDADRVGIWGWSGGGSMSLNAIFKYPDLYHMAISIAPVPNQRYYDTIYQERYMGLPQDNVEGFREGSPVNFAHQLRGDLLLIHGTGDDNCHYQTMEMLIDELIRHDKQFTMMAYPNRSHSISEGLNTSRHLRTLMMNFVLTHLPPPPNEPSN